MRKVLSTLLILLLLTALLLWEKGGHLNIRQQAAPWEPPGAPAGNEPPAPREPCKNHDPLRRAWFGDLHVHTLYSMDSGAWDALGTPDDAYRFARGEAVGLAPFDENGTGQRTVQLETPLDFAAVTDHAEWIGEVNACLSPESAAYSGGRCLAFRGEAELVNTLIPLRMSQVSSFDGRLVDICGQDYRRCRDSLKDAWQKTQTAAERYYDRSSDCLFTTFHGYEYSNNVSLAKVHRNVIFRNERVPELPTSSLEEPEPSGLWDKLESQCNASGGPCEAITIPHNPNVSNGRAFTIEWRGESAAEQHRRAAQRARFEPVVEMMQIKGESECASGLWQVFGEDELCDFEKMRRTVHATPRDCKDDYGLGAIFGYGCQSRLDFVRYALIEGMVEENRIGVNPYRFGFAGSTDAHNANPGDVQEDSYDGWSGERDSSVSARLSDEKWFAGRGAASVNPGGLIGIWAEENSRDFLFDAMQRREVFATSGPRIQPRLFAGFELPEDICDEDFVAQGYDKGIPMGAVLSSGGGRPPLFAGAVSADSQGGLLQRIQIIKVWFDDEGGFHQSVSDIAGDQRNGATVNLDTCQVSGPGAAQLCGVWRDPDFDPGRHAAYYLRAVENPSCRWSWRQCLSLPSGDRPSSCSDPAIPKVIQERAWTSPVWYSPGN